MTGQLLPLPEPDSEELLGLLTSREVVEAYRFLYERRFDPPTMVEWRSRSREVFSKENSQYDRRLRELRKWFDITVAYDSDTREYRYTLVGMLPMSSPDPGYISPKLQSEVFARKGRFCAMCGRGPRDGVRLQIDHIVPASPPWNGPTEFANLEPLCEEHNHGKQAFFSTYDQFGGIIEKALPLGDPWLRIGELLKGFYRLGKPCPVELIEVVAMPTHAGDYKKRVRELRYVLGWPIESRLRRDHLGITHIHYMLTAAAPPWPAEGPREAVNAYERRRRAEKRTSESS